MNITASMINAANQMVYLEVKNSGKKVLLDSTFMVDGKFSFTIKDTYPSPALLRFDSVRCRLFFTIEGGDMTIEGDINNPSKVKRYGTLVADKLNSYYSEIQPLRDKLDSLSVEHNSILRMRISVEEQKAMSRDIHHKYREIANDINVLRNRCIDDNYNNLFGVYLMYRSPARTYEEAQEQLSRLSYNIDDSYYLDKIKERRDNLLKVGVGNMAPDFSIPTVCGDTVSLSSLRGRVVLLHFWGYWSPSGQKNCDEYKEIYEDIRDEDFFMLGVSVCRDDDLWREFLSENNISWCNGSTLKGWDCPIINMYAVNFLPNNILIDKEGRIASYNIRMQDIKGRVSELIAE